MPYKDPEKRREAHRLGEQRRRARNRVPPEPRPCQVCGVEFTPVRKNARYCGHKCQQKAARLAKPEKYREMAYRREKAYKERHPERVKAAARIQQKAIHARRKNDPSYALPRRLRQRMRVALVKGYKTGSAVKELGCSIDFFREYLEGLWTEGMSWDNLGEWHLDHIKPLESYDLTDEEQYSAACHYTNIQPLWAADNYAKGAICGD